MKSLFLALIMILGTFLTNALSQEIRPLKIGVMDFKPFINNDDPKNPNGLFVEMIIKSLDDARIPYESIKGYPPRRHYTNIAKGLTDITIGLKGAKAYDKSVLYSEKVIFTVRAYIFSVLDNPVFSRDISNWTGKYLFLSGYSYGRQIGKIKERAKSGALNLDPSKDHDQMIRKLKQGRGEYAIGYLKPSDAAMKKYGLVDVKRFEWFPVPLVFIFNKNLKNAEEISKRVEDSFWKLEKKGEFEL